MEKHEKQIRSLLAVQGRFYDDVIIKAIIQAIECGDFLNHLSMPTNKMIGPGTVIVTTAAGCEYIPYYGTEKLKERIIELEGMVDNLRKLNG